MENVGLGGWIREADVTTRPSALKARKNLCQF
jgi:hypothetical protein